MFFPLPERSLKFRLQFSPDLQDPTGFAVYSLSSSADRTSVFTDWTLDQPVRAGPIPCACLPIRLFLIVIATKPNSLIGAPAIRHFSDPLSECPPVAVIPSPARDVYTVNGDMSRYVASLVPTCHWGRGPVVYAARPSSPSALKPLTEWIDRILTTSTSATKGLPSVGYVARGNSSAYTPRPARATVIPGRHPPRARAGRR